MSPSRPVKKEKMCPNCKAKSRAFQQWEKDFADQKVFYETQIEGIVSRRDAMLTVVGDVLIRTQWRFNRIVEEFDLRFLENSFKVFADETNGLRRKVAQAQLEARAAIMERDLLKTLNSQGSREYAKLNTDFVSLLRENGQLKDRLSKKSWLQRQPSGIKFICDQIRKVIR